MNISDVSANYQSHSGISPASLGKSGEEVSAIEIEAPTKAHTLSSVATARLNGKRIRVLFDTGSPASLLSERAAQNAGFKRTAPGVVDAGLTEGLGRRAYQSWIASFDTFEIGRERIHHARLRVADMDDADVDMLLGADFFLSHHLYVSNVLHRVWFAYTGGPIFDLQRAAQYAAADSGGDKASRNKQDKLADAADLARRGAAYEARGDPAHAIEDLTRAIQMDPAQTLYLEERAVAYAKQHQSAPALADLDQALKLKPDDLGALVFRAELRAQAQDLQGLSRMQMQRTD